MMNSKKQVLQTLRDEFSRWDELLSGLSEEQVLARSLPSDLSVKDVVAHLWAWQQRTLARVEAALHHREPQFSGWPKVLDPDSDDDLEGLNAWIHETNRDRPWSDVYAAWRSQFQRVLELAEQIPEEDLLASERYAWLGEYTLSFILLASYEHHEEHRLELLEQM